MSVPSTLFIDTNIFEPGYNFESPDFRAFKESIADFSLTLLLPEPIELEIKRHIREHSDAASKALKRAAKDAPFLRKWNEFPQDEASREKLFRAIHKRASDQWKSFLKGFKVVKLDFKGVDVSRIFRWRDQLIVPFTEAKKTEFSDAFAIALLDQYSEKLDGCIAVISADKGVAAACERFSKLLHFPSLASYSAALARSQKSVSSIESALQRNRKMLESAIGREFVDSASFIIDADWEGDVSDVEVVELQDLETELVGVGQLGCLVRFSCTLNFSAHLSYDDYETAVYDGGEAYPLHRIEGETTQEEEVVGVLKLRFVKGETLGFEIERVELEQTDFTIGEKPDY